MSMTKGSLGRVITIFVRRSALSHAIAMEDVLFSDISA
jgi:hypothetical protein